MYIFSKQKKKKKRKMILFFFVDIFSFNICSRVCITSCDSNVSCV